MKAYVYEKPGFAKLIDKEKPIITESTDAIIRMVKTRFVVLIYILLKSIHRKYHQTQHLAMQVLVSLNQLVQV